MGLRPNLIRTAATAVGGAFAGVGGAYLSLCNPGSWKEGISSGQGLMAVALVIFACWNPMACFGAALLFGGAAIGGRDQGRLPLLRRALRADAGGADRHILAPAGHGRRAPANCRSPAEAPMTAVPSSPYAWC
jgi:hypothetical protein